MTFVTTWMIERVLLANTLRNEDRGMRFGIVSSMGQIPMIFSPTLAGLIMTWLGGISVEAIHPLFISFIISAVFSLWVLLKLKTPQVITDFQSKGFLSGFRDILIQSGGVKR